MTRKSERDRPKALDFVESLGIQKKKEAFFLHHLMDEWTIISLVVVLKFSLKTSWISTLLQLSVQAKIYVTIQNREHRWVT
jgi:hypothetical protein